MPDVMRRIAVLASTDAARARLEQAVADLGLELVYSGAVSSSQVAVLREADARVYLIALDPAMEAALDALEDLLPGDDALLLFEDADVLLKREGWDAARWLRHLGVKLGLREDVLPERATVAAVDSAQEAQPMPPATAAGEPLPEVQPATVADAADSAAVVEDVTPLDMAQHDALGGVDTAAVELTEDTFEITFESLPDETSGDATHVASVDGETGGLHWLDPAAAEAASFGEGFDVSAMPAFEPLALQADDSVLDGITIEDSVEATMARASSLDMALQEALSVSTDGPVADADETALHWLDPAAAEGDGLSMPGQDDETTASLAASDDASGPTQVAEPAQEQTPRREGQRDFHRDLASLEARVSALSLAPLEDAPAAAAAAFRPAGGRLVLVHAGIGGPDAVRQLLGGLPESFKIPVLLLQQLGNGRHDRLVEQLKRASSLPVMLAMPGEPPHAGHVHVLPSETGLESGASGVRFVATGTDDMPVTPAASTIHVVLSGTAPGHVAHLLAQSAEGASVLAQSPEGCYDSQAASALIAQGIAHAPPAELAARLAELAQ